MVLLYGQEHSKWNNKIVFLKGRGLVCGHDVHHNVWPIYPISYCLVSYKKKKKTIYKYVKFDHYFKLIINMYKGNYITQFDHYFKLIINMYKGNFITQKSINNTLKSVTACTFCSYHIIICKDKIRQAVHRISFLWTGTTGTFRFCLSPTVHLIYLVMTRTSYCLMRRWWCLLCTRLMCLHWWGIFFLHSQSSKWKC